MSDLSEPDERAIREYRSPVVVAVPDLGQEDDFLARTIRGIAYVEDVEPVAAKVTLELVAFAESARSR